MTDKIILSFGGHTVRIKLPLKGNNIAILSVDSFVMKEWYGTQVIDLILSWGGACRRNFGRTKSSLPGTVSLGNRKPRHNKCQVTSLYGARFLQIRQEAITEGSSPPSTPKEHHLLTHTQLVALLQDSLSGKNSASWITQNYIGSLCVEVRIICYKFSFPACGSNDQ